MPVEKRELRQEKRLSLQIPVRLSKREDQKPGGSFYISSLIELSPNGAFISTSAHYQMGTVIALEFDLPHENAAREVIRTMGQITWSSLDAAQENSPLGVGIEFVKISPDQKKCIRNFIANQAADA